jgi:hypothetical protein
VKPFEQRFWEQVDPMRTPENGCLRWIGARSEGYGVMRVAGRSRRATHVALFLASGRWPTGVVMHDCDAPPCVEVGHLREGTLAENHADMMAKGRQARGERVGGAKLTADQVLQIRAALEAGETGQSQAVRFGVTRQAISYVKRMETWRYLVIG